MFPVKVCLERAMKRAESSGAMVRSDDNLESFKKRSVSMSIVQDSSHMHSGLTCVL